MAIMMQDGRQAVHLRLMRWLLRVRSSSIRHGAFIYSIWLQKGELFINFL